jgi:hypothetical protein
MSALEVVEVLEGARRVLFERRSTRPRPHLDDKVLTAWNGLMIAAFARVARVVPGAEEFLDDATRAARFIRRHLWDQRSATLLRRYRQGDARVDGYAEDYAYLIFGLLELFQAGGDPEWLEWALRLQERQDALFWDEVDGGWFSTTGKDPSVLLRLKEDYDGAEPAASSVSVLNLLTLGHLFADEKRFDEQIRQTLAAFASRAGQMGRSVPMMLAALSTYHAGMPQIVLVGPSTSLRAGEPWAEETLALWSVLQEVYVPTAIVVPVLAQHREALARLLPWVASMRAVDGRATAYVCRDFACQAPATSAAQLKERLKNSQA